MKVPFGPDIILWLAALKAPTNKLLRGVLFVPCCSWCISMTPHRSRGHGALLKSSANTGSSSQYRPGVTTQSPQTQLKQNSPSPQLSRVVVVPRLSQDSREEAKRLHATIRGFRQCKSFTLAKSVSKLGLGPLSIPAGNSSQLSVGGPDREKAHVSLCPVIVAVKCTNFLV